MTDLDEQQRSNDRETSEILEMQISGPESIPPSSAHATTRAKKQQCARGQGDLWSLIFRLIYGL